LNPTFARSIGIFHAPGTRVGSSLLALLAALVTSSLAAQEAAQEPPAEPPRSSEASPVPEPAAKATPPALAIEIDLTAQKAWVLQDGHRVYETPISSGRTGHETPTGDFSVLE